MIIFIYKYGLNCLLKIHTNSLCLLYFHLKQNKIDKDMSRQATEQETCMAAVQSRWSQANEVENHEDVFYTHLISKR